MLDVGSQQNRRRALERVGDLLGRMGDMAGSVGWLGLVSHPRCEIWKVLQLDITQLSADPHTGGIAIPPIEGGVSQVKGLSFEPPGGSKMGTKCHKKFRRIVGASVLGLAVLPMSSHAFEVILKPTTTEVKLAKKISGIQFRSRYPVAMGLVHAFANPVHEGITHFAYQCPLTFRECADADLDAAPSGVIIGLRWNDDPPFRFGKNQGRYSTCNSYTRPESPSTISYALAFDCWLEHFQRSKSEAEHDPNRFLKGDGTLLARSHFGDLQFLHSMASGSGVSPQQTKAKIMMWAEFAWRVQSRDKSERIPASTRIGAVPVAGMAEHFPAQEERSVELLFALGRPWVRHQLADIAFGSLLHMVQDSFAGGHAERRAVPSDACNVPKIVQFHSYAGQPSSEHKTRDGLDAAELKVADGGGATTRVLRELIRLRDEGARWVDVQLYLSDCAFRLANDAVPSSSSVSD